MSNVGIRIMHTGSSIIHAHVMSQSDMMVNNSINSCNSCLTTVETLSSSITQCQSTQTIWLTYTYILFDGFLGVIYCKHNKNEYLKILKSQKLGLEHAQLIPQIPFQLDLTYTVRGYRGHTGLGLLTSNIDLPTSYELWWCWSQINSAKSIEGQWFPTPHHSHC